MAWVDRELMIEGEVVQTPPPTSRMFPQVYLGKDPKLLPMGLAALAWPQPHTVCECESEKGNKIIQHLVIPWRCWYPLYKCSLFPFDDK